MDCDVLLKFIFGVPGQPTKRGIHQSALLGWFHDFKNSWYKNVYCTSNWLSLIPFVSNLNHEMCVARLNICMAECTTLEKQRGSKNRCVMHGIRGGTLRWKGITNLVFLVSWILDDLDVPWHKYIYAINVTVTSCIDWVQVGYWYDMIFIENV